MRAYMYVHVYVCVCVCVSVCVCICPCVRVSVCAYLYICAYVCIFMYVFLPVGEGFVIYRVARHQNVVLILSHQLIEQLQFEEAEVCCDVRNAM
jgi:hypothetical protein